MEFSDVTLDAGAMELARAGERVPVEPQVMEVLTYLVRHRERVVLKAELLDEVWGDRFVSESALSSRIKSARQAIGDNGHDQRLIRTIHGRGFRFVGEVHEVGGAPTGVEAANAPSVPAPGVGGPAALLERLATGRGAAIELSGPSRARREWVDELVHRAEAAAMLTCRGRGAGELRPYGSVLEAIDEALTRRPELAGQVPEPCRAELTGVLDGAPPTAPQRLLVSARELLAAGARTGGIVLVIEDAHLAERATVELLQHLARGVRRQPALLVVTTRGGVPPNACFEAVVLDGEPAGTDEVPVEVRGTLERMAVLGESMTFVEALAATGLPLAEAQRAIDVALGSSIVERHEGGLRFADAELAEAISATCPPAERSAILRSVAEQLVRQEADPRRIADRLVAAGDGQAAAPHQVRAAQVAAGLGHHHDVLARTSDAAGVFDRAVRRSLLELRADALGELGDSEAVRVYREVLALTEGEPDPWLRARLARALVRANDPQGARDALRGVDLERAEHPGVRLVGAMALYLCGEIDQAEVLVDGLRELALAPGAPAQLLDVIAMQGMVAHSRGEWFDRLRKELRLLAGSTDLARTVFDAHVCVAQYLLYGPTGYEEVISLARDLRRSAEEIGSERAVAFADTLQGEALLLSGDLDGARGCLEAAVAAHRATHGDTGLAHSLQRLAEVHLQAGDRAESARLLQQALPLARWSPLSQHLLQRVYGTLVAAAPTPEEAAAVADDALAVLDGPESCDFCQIMVAVPAAIAFAGVGRFDDARAQVAVAKHVAVRWDGPAWPAAADEAAGLLARAEGREDEALSLLERAARGFDSAGQPLDAARCREAI